MPEDTDNIIVALHKRIDELNSKQDVNFVFSRIWTIINTLREGAQGQKTKQNA